MPRFISILYIILPGITKSNSNGSVLSKRYKAKSWISGDLKFDQVL